jgi:dipeptidyl aminopeptidase/acylaminoacyl peptidase
VFAAAVSDAGPSSLVTLAPSFPAHWRPLLASTWSRYVGDPENPDDLAGMERRSPLIFVDRITTPLLVIRGANAPRVTKQESQIVAALRARWAGRLHLQGRRRPRVR